MLFGAGCLYTAPVWSPDVNQDPRIIQPEGEQGQEHPLALLPVGSPAIVVATDPDEDELVFLWVIPGHENLQPTTSVDEGGTWVSTVAMPYDPALDGALVQVIVIDQSPAKNSERVLFRVEVVQ